MADGKGLVGDFVAFLSKVNAISLAIGVVVGVAVNDLVKAIVDNLINPFVSMVVVNMGGSGAAWVVAILNIVGAVIRFVAVMFILYLFSKAFLREAKKEAPPA